MAALVGMGVLGTLAAGCNLASESLESAGDTEAEETVAETQQGVTSGNVCWLIQRSGTTGQVADAHVYAKGASNYGTSTGLAVGFATLAGVLQQERASLLRFDLSSIQQNPGTQYTFNRAAMQLAEAINGGSEGAGMVNVYKVTSAWTEMGVTWPTVPTTVSSAFTSFVTIATNAQSPTARIPDVSLLGLVTGWLANPASNFGVMLKQSNKATQFASSEYSTVSMRPALVVGASFACNPGYADCNGDSNAVPCARHDGCEVHIAADVNNCGGCGTVCSVPNAAPSCVDGACQVGSCNPGFVDCDGNAANGCETAGSSCSTGSGVSSAALVCGGDMMSSASYAMVSALGEPLTGEVATSAHYRLQGGLVGMTQTP